MIFAMRSTSCLTLILACIVYSQAGEISRLATAADFNPYGRFEVDLDRRIDFERKAA